MFYVMYAAWMEMSTGIREISRCFRNLSEGCPNRAANIKIIVIFSSYMLMCVTFVV